MLQHFRPFQPNNPVQPKYLCQKNPLNFHCSISFFQDDHINTMAKITFEIDPAQVNLMMQ